MKRIPLFTSQLTDKDIAEGERVLRRNYQLTKGEEVVEFERALAEYVGRKYCVVVNSGCSAFNILLQIMDAQHLRVDIAMQKFTYHGMRWIAHKTDSDVHYLPIEKETYGIKFEKKYDVDEFYNNILLTHIAGFPARDTEKFVALRAFDEPFIIEDACQGFGASIDDKKVGSFGSVAMLSFCQNKLITTGGEGGALLLDDDDDYKDALKIREYNYRMSSHQAAIGLSQLSRIDEIIEERRRQAHILNKVYPCALKELPGHYQTYQMYLVKPEVEVPDYCETKMRFDGCELLKEIPLALSQVVADQSEQK